MRAVALVILDACRADHLGCYGYHKTTSPNIDSLAKDSLLFVDAHAPGTSTQTSLPRILTGNPSAGSIGPIARASRSPPIKIGRLLLSSIPEELVRFLGPALRSSFHAYTRFGTLDKGSLIEEFQARMVTCCVTGNPDYHFGCHLGFDEYYPLYLDLGLGIPYRLIARFGGADSTVPPEAVTDTALEFLDRNHSGFFLLCHYLQPHTPYASPSLPKSITRRDLVRMKKKRWSGDPPEPYLIEKAVLAYDENVRWVDSGLRPLIERCLDLGCMIVITSDHGELLGEHQRLGHPDGMNAPELTRVPLIVHEGERRIVDERYDLSRLLPDLLECATKDQTFFARLGTTHE